MRKLIVFMHMSLDGYVSAADKGADWGSADSSSDIFASAVPKLIKDADTLLLGRLLSDELLGYWLNAEAGSPGLSKGELAYARWATGAKKVILSKHDEKPKWPNTEMYFVKDDPTMVEAIAGAKKAPGKNIIVHGGVRTVRDLARLGLVDEYQLVIHPVILGSGMSIFTGVKNIVPLKLKDVESLKGGALVATYEPSDTAQ
ncbi:MAG TPA: dihydrofolate reductase family protein [Gammaproteobacteria bacterium]|nr:dihydrofolate reductase family protein [Gammaproteobacteria bacterium]